MSRVRIKGPSTGGQNLRGFNKRVRQLTAEAAIATAAAGAPVITGVMGADFDAGNTAYGTPRPLGKHGNAVSLRLTGQLRRALKFVTDGTTKIRAVVNLVDKHGRRYVPYVIGRFSPMPNGNAAMPQRWRQELRYVAIARCGELASKAFRGFG